MGHIPTELRYTKDHEWLRTEADGSLTVGITDHAQAALGDIVFVELPDVGAKLAAGAAVAVVESVKSASDVYAPLAGEVVAVNAALADAPDAVNADPYGNGWLYRLNPDADNAALLDAAAYTKLIEA